MYLGAVCRIPVHPAGANWSPSPSAANRSAVPDTLRNPAGAPPTRISTPNEAVEILPDRLCDIFFQCTISCSPTSAFRERRIRALRKDIIRRITLKLRHRICDFSILKLKSSNSFREEDRAMPFFRIPGKMTRSSLPISSTSAKTGDKRRALEKS